MKTPSSLAARAGSVPRRSTENTPNASAILPGGSLFLQAKRHLSVSLEDPQVFCLAAVPGSQLRLADRRRPHAARFPVSPVSHSIQDSFDPHRIGHLTLPPCSYSLFEPDLQLAVLYLHGAEFFPVPAVLIGKSGRCIALVTLFAGQYTPA